VHQRALRHANQAEHRPLHVRLAVDHPQITREEERPRPHVRQDLHAKLPDHRPLTVSRTFLLSNPDQVQAEHPVIVVDPVVAPEEAALVEVVQEEVVVEDGKQKTFILRLSLCRKLASSQRNLAFAK
jgi:hypothetical protein